MNLRRVLEGGEENKMRACVLVAWKGGRGRGRVGWRQRDGRFKPKESGGCEALDRVLRGRGKEWR